MKSRGELSGGSKCSLKYLQGRMREMQVDWKALWHQIILVCLKTLYCVQDSIPHNPNCFELYGFDVLIDAGQADTELLLRRFRLRFASRVSPSFHARVPCSRSNLEQFISTCPRTSQLRL